MIFMKNKNRIVLIILSLLFSLLSYSERIKNLDVNIQISDKGVLQIIENIEYDPEGEYHHGIKRDIPYVSSYNIFDLDTNILISMDDIQLDGNNINWNEDKKASYYNYRIGDADRYLDPDNTHIFTLKYKIYNVIRTKDDIAQIYLNAVGQNWSMPINNARITLVNIGKNNIKDVYTYTGRYGENSGKEVLINEENNNIVFAAKDFAPYEGMTFKLNLDNKYIGYSLSDINYNHRIILLDYIFGSKMIVGISIIMFIISIILSILLYLSYKRNADKRAIVPEYREPKDISPAFAGYIYEKEGIKSSNKSYMSIMLLTFISKNLVEYNEEDEIEYVKEYDGQVYKNKKNWHNTWKYRDIIYKFKENSEENAMNNLLFLEEQEAFNKMYLSKNDILKSDKRVYEVEGIITKILNNKFAVITKNNSFLKIIIILINILVFIGNIILLINNKILLTEAIIGLITSSIILIIVLLKNKYNYTQKGKDIIRYLKGFELYIKTAEKHEMDFIKNEIELIKYFKDILPFAVALGIEKECLSLVDKLVDKYGYNKDDVYTNIAYDSWYNAYFLSRIINSKYNNAVTSINNSRPRSGGGGFSSGSGGFSGGGFSGGGGSSW